MPHVFSTLSNDQLYTTYGKGPDGITPIVDRQVLIKGGANIANKVLVTPRGAMTTVNESDMALLEAHEVFKLHLAQGFVSISKNKGDPEKAAANMTGRDKSAPYVPQDFDAQGGAKPMEGKPDKKKTA